MPHTKFRSGIFVKVGHFNNPDFHEYFCEQKQQVSDVANETAETGTAAVGRIPIINKTLRCFIIMPLKIQYLIVEYVK